MRFPAPEDRPLADSLRALPGVGAGVCGETGAGAVEAGPRSKELFARAELHGVAGVIWDAWKAAGVAVEPALVARLESAAIARELDHDAHVAVLRTIDACLEAPAIVLKGPLFARRYYRRPSTRGTSDVDLLVSEEALEQTIASLATLRYTVLDSKGEIAWSRRAHHHLHLTRPRSPDLELHFHAYRGFGVTLRSDALAERSVPVSSFDMLRVPAAEDELVYLAVHAASHRFGRFSWLYDMRLVVERMSANAIETAARRARALGLSRVLSLAGELLVETLGVAPETVRPFGTLARGRRALVHAVIVEPRMRALGRASRFAYTTMLADSISASLRYARTSSVEHARRLLGLD